MTVVLPEDFPEIPGSDQCESRPLHKAAKERLIAQKKRLADFRKQRAANPEPLTHTVEIGERDQIQIDVDKLFDKGGTR